MDADVSRQAFEETLDIGIFLESQSIISSDVYQLQRRDEGCYIGETCKTLGQG